MSFAISIPLERHFAEVRRALSDEKLYTIAYKTSGPSIFYEWSIEGKRLIPLVQRDEPETKYSSLANICAKIESENNKIKLSTLSSSCLKMKKIEKEVCSDSKLSTTQQISSSTKKISKSFQIKKIAKKYKTNKTKIKSAISKQKTLKKQLDDPNHLNVTLKNSNSLIDRTGTNNLFTKNYSVNNIPSCDFGNHSTSDDIESATCSKQEIDSENDFQAENVLLKSNNSNKLELEPQQCDNQMKLFDQSNNCSEQLTSNENVQFQHNADFTTANSQNTNFFCKLQNNQKMEDFLNKQPLEESLDIKDHDNEDNLNDNFVLLKPDVTYSVSSNKLSQSKKQN